MVVLWVMKLDGLDSTGGVVVMENSRSPPVVLTNTFRCIIAILSWGTVPTINMLSMETGPKFFGFLLKEIQ